MDAATIAILTGTSSSSVFSTSGGTLPDVAQGKLYMSVDGVTTIQRFMYMLPPQPLVGINGGTDLFLVTLVDFRYFANFGSVTNADGNWGSTGTTGNKWGDLILRAVNAALASVSTTTSGVWPPESVYGQPDIDSDFYTYFGPPDSVAEAALWNVGRTMSADYVIIRWSDASGFATAARAAAAPNKIAGGQFWNPLQSGATEFRTGPVMPNSITTVFPFWYDGYGYYDALSAIGSAHSDDADPRTHSGDGEYGNVQSQTYGPADLGSPYTSLVVTPGTINANNLTLRTTAKAVFDTATGLWNSANKTALQALALQLTKDFYDYQLQNFVETYRGLVSFDSRACLDVVYSYWPEPMTRVSRRPFNDYPTQFGHGLSDITVAERVQIVHITGVQSGGFWPAVIAPGGTSTGVVVNVKDANNSTLTVGLNYLAIRAKAPGSASPVPLYYTCKD
jgi:hypothetical protein